MLLTILETLTSFKDGHFEPTTYREAYETAVAFAGGLLAHGVMREEHIGIISDNRKEWEHADMGLMMLGAIDVPRGCDATIGDLEYILSFAECKRVIVENSSQIEKILGIKEKLPLVNEMIVFEKPTEKDLNSTKEAGVSLFSFEQIVEEGKKYNEQNPGKVDEEMEKGNSIINVLDLFEEEEIINYLTQICLALNHIHKKKIIILPFHNQVLIYRLL